MAEVCRRPSNLSRSAPEIGTIGWVLGDLEFDDFQLRMTCVELQITIVNVDYRSIVQSLLICLTS
jgi:hypothetical protein